MEGRRTLVLTLSLLLFALWGVLQIPTSALSQDLEGPFRVARVMDGDTVVLDDGRRLRYIGINASERGERLWRDARDYNARKVKGKLVMLERGEVKEDGYGRILAYVYVGTEMINAQLVKVGLAYLFVLEPMKYYSYFRGLQEAARAKKLGIWGRRGFKGPVKITRLKADAEGDDRYNLNGEYVRICNICPTDINVTGFSLSDREGHRYTLPQAVLQPGYTLLVLTGKGKDIVEGAYQLRLYWGSGSPIWNNKGDVAYLRDAEGRLIDTFVYKRRYH